jgi:hypothetical protein
VSSARTEITKAGAGAVQFVAEYVVFDAYDATNVTVIEVLGMVGSPRYSALSV